MPTDSDLYAPVGGPGPDAPQYSPAPRDDPNQTQVMARPAPPPPPPPPPLPHPIYNALQPNQAIYEPQHPAFQPQQFVDRFAEFLHHWKEQTGTEPSPPIARDLVRSGLPMTAVREVAKYMHDNPPVPPGAAAQVDPDNEIEAFNQLSPEAMTILRQKRWVSTPDAGHSGVRYDPKTDTFYVNMKYPGDIENQKSAILHALLNQLPRADLYHYMEQLRNVNPQAVAKTMPFMDSDDPAGALEALYNRQPKRMPLEPGGSYGHTTGPVNLKDFNPFPLPPQLQLKNQTSKGWLGTNSAPEHPEIMLPGAEHGHTTELKPDDRTNLLKNITDFISWTTAKGYETKPGHAGAEAIFGTPDALTQIERHLAEETGVEANPSLVERAYRQGYLSKQDYDAYQIKWKKVQADALIVKQYEDNIGAREWQTPQELFPDTYAELEKNNPGAAVMLNLANPVGWLGPGIATKPFRLARDIPLIMRAGDDISRAKKAYVAAASVVAGPKNVSLQTLLEEQERANLLGAEATKALQGAGLERANRAKALSDIEGRAWAKALDNADASKSLSTARPMTQQEFEQNYLLHGTTAEGAEGIKKTGKIGGGGKPVYLTPSATQAQSFAGETGKIFTVPKGAAPLSTEQQVQRTWAQGNLNNLAGRMSLKHQGEFTPEHEIPGGHNPYEYLLGQNKVPTLTPPLAGTTKFKEISQAKQAINSLTAKIKDPKTDPLIRDSAVADRNKLIDDLRRKILTTTVQTSPEIARTAGEIRNLEAAIQVAVVKGLASGEPEEIPRLMDKLEAAKTRLSDAQAPLGQMRDIQHVLDKEAAAAQDKWIKAQAETDFWQEQARRTLNGGNSKLARTFNAMNAIIANHLRNTDEAVGLLQQNLRDNADLSILAETAHKMMRKELTPEEAKNFMGWIEGTTPIPNDIRPEVLDTINATKSSLSMTLMQLDKQDLVHELIENFYPHLIEQDQQAFDRIFGYRAALGSPNSYHFNLRVPFGKEIIDAHPGQVMERYYKSVGKALVIRRSRAAVADPMTSVGVKGPRAWFDFKDFPVNGEGPGPKYIPITTQPGLNGWVHQRVAGILDEMTKSDPMAAGNPLAYAIGKFNNLYKAGAMYNPLIHGMNQFSSGFLNNTLGAFLNIPLGKAIEESPEMLAQAGREMYMRPGHIMQDAVTNLARQGKLTDEGKDILGIFQTTRSAFDAFGGVKEGMHNILWKGIVRNQQLGAWFIWKQAAKAHGLDEFKAGVVAGALAERAMAGVQAAETQAKLERAMSKYVAFALTWSKKHIVIPIEAISRKAILVSHPDFDQKMLEVYQAQLRLAIVRQVAVTFGTLQLLNIAMSGHPTWENEDGRWFALDVTKIYDAFGWDHAGKPQYASVPSMNFIRWYTDLAQMGQDYGVAKGTMEAVMSKAMPELQEGMYQIMNVDDLSDEERVGHAVQSFNPIQRNVFQPAAEAISVYSLPEGREHDRAVQAFVRGVAASVLGERMYSGARKPYNVNLGMLDLIRKREVEAQLAIDGIDPLWATPEQRAQAQEKLKGFNVEEAGRVALGANVGSAEENTRLTQLQRHFDQLLTTAVKEQGHTDEEIADANGAGKSLWTLVDSTQKEAIYEAHPELLYFNHAQSLASRDKYTQDLIDQRTRYYATLHTLSLTHEQAEEKLDAALGNGSINRSKWINQYYTLNSHYGSASDELRKTYGLTDEQEAYILKSLGKDPTDLSKQEKAFDEYHKLGADPKYIDPDTQEFDSKQWNVDRNEFLSKLSPDIKQYILNRDMQTKTPLVRQFLQASEANAQLRAANPSLEEMRKTYNSLSSFQKNIYLESNPELKAYFDYRDAWFKGHPDVAKWFHPKDLEQYKNWSPQQQAENLADWFTFSHSKTPTKYLSPWQLAATQSPQLFAQLTRGWGPNEFQMFEEFIQQYYQDRANSRSNFLASLARGRAKSRATRLANRYKNASSQSTIFSNTQSTGSPVRNIWG